MRVNSSGAFDESPGRRGLIASVAVHVLLGAVFMLGDLSGEGQLSEAPIYSVSLEGGKTIGGRSQVSTSKDKTPPAPPKNVGGSKAEPKPTPAPKPTPKPQATPKATPVPKPEEKKDEIKTGPEKKPEEVKPTPKPEPTPQATATPKPQPTQAPKPTATPDAKKTPEKPQKAVQKKPEDLESQYQRAMQRYLGESTDAGGQGFGAARIGGSGMGGGVVKPPEFFQYRALLIREVKSGWQWYSRRDVLIAEVELQIAKDGTILSERIVKSSGNREYDNSVLRAVRKADPLPPPPAKVYEDFKVVRVIFDPRD